MKTYFLLVLAFANYFFAFSQDSTITEKKDTTYWKKDFKAGLNLSQAAFSDNWKGGGVSNVNYLAFLNYKANYKKNKTTWDNLIDFQYGQIFAQATPEFRKSTDRIFLDSKLGYKINKNWNLFASANFQSQFDAGFDYSRKRNIPIKLGDKEITDSAVYISGFFNPAYFTETFGFEYKPVEYFFARLGVAAFKQTIVTNPLPEGAVPNNYGVDRNKSIRNEFGLFNLFTGLNKDLTKTINLKATYQMFFNNYAYFFKRVDGYPDIIEAYIDQRFDLIFTAKVSKYLNTQIIYTGLYDYDQDSEYQFAQSLSFGLLYTWDNKKKK
ncbi:MAG: DUF3078 domain-containing protein [Cytophagales bacterium]